MEWNLQYGGAHERLPGMIEAVRRHDPDVMVLLEFRPERIIEVSLSLAAQGFSYILNSQPPPRTNGILIASKSQLELLDSPRPASAPHRWMEVSPERSDLRILAVHVPGASDLAGKMEFWQALLEYGRESNEAGDRRIIVGDLSTGLARDTEGVPFLGNEHLSALLDMGWRDVWREYHQLGREYSWYSSSGKGMRTDHALASPGIKHPMWAKYSHQERESGLSDHSILILDIMHRMNESGSRSSPLYRFDEGPGCAI